MYHGIESPLHERRVDITEYFESLGRHTGTEGHGMLFGNTHIECAVRHFLHHEFQGRPGRHSGGDTEYFIILFRQFDHGMTKHILVFGRLWDVKFLFLDFTGQFIKQTRCMPLGLVLFGQRIAFPLGRDHVQDLGTGYFTQIAECIHQFGHIMTINRAKIAQVQGFKEIGTAADHPLHPLNQFMGHGPGKVFTHRQFSHQFPHIVFHFIIRGRGGDISEVFFQRTHIRVNADSVIIQDDQHIRVRDTRMVHAFESQSGGHGTIPDHGDHFTVFFAFVFSRHGHTQCCGNRRGGVSYPECIIFTFASFGKTA